MSLFLFTILRMYLDLSTCSNSNSLIFNGCKFMILFVIAMNIMTTTIIINNHCDLKKSTRQYALQFLTPCPNIPLELNFNYLRFVYHQWFKEYRVFTTNRYHKELKIMCNIYLILLTSFLQKLIKTFVFL